MKTNKSNAYEEIEIKKQTEHFVISIDIIGI